MNSPLTRKCYQVFKTEMELHMINIIYVALPMRAQTEKTTFLCKDDCTLMKHTRRWTYRPRSDYYRRAVIFWLISRPCRPWNTAKGNDVQCRVCFVFLQLSLHENVVFSVCAQMGIAAYIMFIMWNSISGLDTCYHFRLNISCGVAVTVRGHPKKHQVTF